MARPNSADSNRIFVERPTDLAEKCCVSNARASSRFCDHIHCRVVDISPGFVAIPLAQSCDPIADIEKVTRLIGFFRTIQHTHCPIEPGKHTASIFSIGPKVSEMHHKFLRMGRNTAWPDQKQ